LNEPRLADPGLPAQQHHLALAGQGVGPARQQQVELLVAADQRRQAAHGGGLKAAARLAGLAGAVHRDRLVDAFHDLCPELLEHEQAFDQPARAVADQHGAGLGQLLQAGGDVGGLADDCHLVAKLASADVAGDHEAGVDAHPDRDLHSGSHDLGVQRLHRLDDLQTGLDRAPGVVLVGARKAEVYENAVADVVTDVGVEPPDDLGARPLVAADHLVQILRVHARGQRGGTDHVAEHHGQLAPFGFPTRAGGRTGRRLRRGPGGSGRDAGFGQSGDRPHEPLAVAERDPELGQVGLGQIGEHVEIDAVLGEQLGVSAEADLLEPVAHLGHRSLRAPPGPLARSLDRFCRKA
jgi:hypothetical protein